MNCSNCGNPLSPGLRFCPRCGSPVSQHAVTTTPPAYVPPGGQMQTSWAAGPQGVQPRKSRAGKILLVILVLLIFVGVGAGVAIYFGYRYVEGSLKSSEAYQLAEAELRRSEAVAEHLGQIRSTGFPVGTYKVEADGSGIAVYTMSVEGTKASGRYFVSMVREGGTWRITRAGVQVDGAEMIDVVSDSEGSGEQKNTEEVSTEDEAPEARAGAAAGGKTISAGVLNGKAISKPAPAYPAAARALKAAGLVTVEVEVDEKGNVTTARAVSGHPLLRPAAEAAARQARFSPTLLSGKPVRLRGVLTYNFQPE